MILKTKKKVKTWRLRAARLRKEIVRQKTGEERSGYHDYSDDTKAKIVRVEMLEKCAKELETLCNRVK